MPQSMLEQIKEASKGALVFCFVGVGSAFAKKNDQTSLIIAKDGKTILVDIGTTIPMALNRQGMKVFDFDYYFFTHSHADHVGGAEELLLMSRYVMKRKVPLIITEPYFGILWDQTLRGGCEHNEEPLLRFSDLVNPMKPIWVQSQPREAYRIVVDGIELLIFRTAHTPGNVKLWEEGFWSTGILVDRTVLFTGDTRFDPSLFVHLRVENGVRAIFHDCQLFSPGTVHASYDELNTRLRSDVKAITRLTHYGDTFEKFTPENDGFQGFAKPWEIYRWPCAKEAKAPADVQDGAHTTATATSTDEGGEQGTVGS